MEIEVAEGEDDVSRVKITIFNNNGLPDGIIANLVFKVTKEFTFEEVGTDEPPDHAGQLGFSLGYRREGDYGCAG